MKNCPQCRQNYSDDTMFCLSDGTPLIFANDPPEEVTIVRTLPFILPNIQPQGQPIRQGVSPVFAYLSIGLLLFLLLGGGIFLLIFALNKISTPNNQNSNPNFNLNSTPANDEPNKLNQQANKQSEFEKEKQRIENERKKLEVLKNIPTPPPTVSTPTPSTPAPPQPTARIKFNRGSVSQIVSGTVYTQRSFVLEARSGQFLTASVISGGGCVVFSNGSANLSYVTNSGDNRLTLANNCSSSAKFSLTVFIK